MLSAAVLVPVVHHYQLRIALGGYIAGLKAKGEPMDLAQLIPSPAPPEQNGAPFITNSITNLDHRNVLTSNPPVSMCIVAPGRAMIGWQQPDLRSPEGTNTWEEVARELAAERNTLDGLHAVTNHSLFDFRIDYGRGSGILLPHLMYLRHAWYLLKASALFNLHNGNVKEACADTRTILALANGQSQEPMQISQQVRMADAFVGVAATWELLQNPNVSEDDLRLLQQCWESTAFLKQVERAYLMERAFTILEFERGRQNPDGVWQWVIYDSAAKKEWEKYQWRWFWSFSDEKHALQIYQVLIDATRMAETNSSYETAKAFTEVNFLKLGMEKPEIRDDFFRIDIDESQMRSLASESARESFTLLRRSLAAETARNLTITAIALRRYELAHQQPPGSLQELIPAFLTSAPVDWMDGQPLRYRLNSDGTFLLYSVGENGKDDGGSSTLWDKDHGGGFYWENPYALDRVWPLPATSEQTKKYYADQARKPK